MRTVIVLAVALAAAPLAGCIGDLAGTVESQSVPDLSSLAFLVNDHDHLDPALHHGEKGLSLLAYDGLSADFGEPLTYGELDVVGDLAVVAFLQPIGGFVTVDVKDPAAPKVLGYYTAGTAYAADVKLSPDGKLAFLAVNGGYAHSKIQENPMLAPSLSRSAGIHVVDVSDPANPMRASFYPLPTGGVHMLDVHVLHDMVHVFSVVSSGLGTPVGVPIPGGNPGMTSRIEIAVLEDGPTGPALKHEFDYAPPEAERAPVGWIGPHDVTVVDDPELGILMLGAYGRAGVTVAQIADGEVKHLGTWTGHEDQYVHTVMMDYVDGKRVIFATPEAFNGEKQNQLWILDASDPADMQLIGTWSLPGEHPFDGGYRFSTHNFNILDGKLYLAHFHAGVWVLDVSTADKLASPPVLGYYSPRETGNVGTSLGIPAVPLVWDVVPAKGKVMVADITTGFYVLDAEWEIPDALPYGTRGA